MNYLEGSSCTHTKTGFGWRADKSDASSSQGHVCEALRHAERIETALVFR